MSKRTLSEMQSSFQKFEYYVARDALKQSLRWASIQRRDTLYHTTLLEEAVLIMPMKVLTDKFFVKPFGNFHSKMMKTLKEAKYRLIGGRPDHVALAKDFDKGLELLTFLQMKKAKGGPSRNLLVMSDDHKIDGVAMSAPVVMPKTTPTPTVYLADLEAIEEDEKEIEDVERSQEKGKEKEAAEEEEIRSDLYHEDTNMATYMNDEMQVAFRPIEDTHYPIPFPVYEEGSSKMVPPHEVEEKLSNAQIRADFTVSHYFITKEEHFHSFTANVQQIMILSQQEIVESPYKKRRPFGGPVMPRIAGSK